MENNANSQTIKPVTDSDRITAREQIRVHLYPNVAPYDPASLRPEVIEESSSYIPQKELGWATPWEVDAGNKCYHGREPFVQTGAYRNWHRAAWSRQDQKYYSPREREDMWRNIVVDDGTKSLQEQIVEWNHKPENIRTLNDWLCMPELINYCRYYYKMHQNDIMPEVVSGAAVWGNPGTGIFSRRGDILEQCLLRIAKPQHKEDINAFLKGMRIVQQFPNVIWERGSVGDTLSEESGRIFNEDFLDPRIDYVDYGVVKHLFKPDNNDWDDAMCIGAASSDYCAQPIRPAWSYRIDPDEHLREHAFRITFGDRVAEMYMKDGDDFESDLSTPWVLGCDDDPAHNGYMFEHSDEPFDPDPETAYPDYGWTQDIDSHVISGLGGNSATVLKNRALLEKLFADPDFDMMTGYSRSTGKRIYPKYYDKNGNELEEYTFRFGTPWVGQLYYNQTHFKPESLEAWERIRAEERQKAAKGNWGAYENPLTKH